MAVNDLEIIDAISIDKNDNVVLTISDHLEWDDKNEHLLLLQNKINLYLNAIEGGSLNEQYPNAISKKIIINIVSKFLPNKDGQLFLKQVRSVLEDAGYTLTCDLPNTLQ